MRYSYEDSPIGPLTLIGDDAGGLAGLYMAHPWRPDPDDVRDDDAFAAVREQLAEYFAGHRREFDVPLALEGTPFQREVWRALQDIPYGTTTSYGEVARRIGRPSAVRAVGLANGRNPVSIIVPCHRVIGASGSLIGYGGGLERKRRLLALEAGVPELPLV